MADSRRDQEYLGIDSNVLVAYLVADHPAHRRAASLRKKRHAVNPTVLHEAYHTCVFKLKRAPDETVTTLTDYMGVSKCIPLSSKDTELGLRLALRYSLGGRDALILASYALADGVNKFVTMDNSLLEIKTLKIGKRKLLVQDLA